MTNRFIGKKVTRLQRRFTFSPSHLLTSSRGFTIIELLVAVGLFSVVVAIAVGGFARALRTQRQTQLLLAANSNASEVLESIAREIRTGVAFLSLEGELRGFVFVNARQDFVRYFWRDNALWRQVGFPPPGMPSTAGKITGDNVRITDASFRVSGTNRADGYPPRITIAFRAQPSSTDPGIAESSINLQTTVSDRLPDDNPAQLLVRKSVEGGTAGAKDFMMAVVGYHVRPCTTPEAYASSTYPNDQARRVAEVKAIRDELTRNPDPPLDPLGGVCRSMIVQSDPPDICLFPGSLTPETFGDTWVAMAAGDYCVDERRASFYEKSFERYTNPDPTQAPESEGDCTKENNLSGDTIDSIKVNQQKICVVKNLAR